MASRKVGMFGVEPNEFIDDRSEDGVAALLRRRREASGVAVNFTSRNSAPCTREPSAMFSWIGGQSANEAHQAPGFISLMRRMKCE